MENPKAAAAGGSKSHSPLFLQLFWQPGSALSHHQNFSDVIAREEEFNRREIAEEIFNVPVMEDSLQREYLASRSARSFLAMIAFCVQGVHLQSVVAGKAVAVARGVGPGFPRVEESQ